VDSVELSERKLLNQKEDSLADDRLHYGCVASKTLMKTAKVYHEIKHAVKFGLPQVDVKPVDFQQVSNRIRSVFGVIQKHDSVERFCSLGARVNSARQNLLTNIPFV